MISELISSSLKRKLRYPWIIYRPKLLLTHLVFRWIFSGFFKFFNVPPGMEVI